MVSVRTIIQACKKSHEPRRATVLCEGLIQGHIVHTQQGTTGQWQRPFLLQPFRSDHPFSASDSTGCHYIKKNPESLRNVRMNVVFSSSQKLLPGIKFEHYTLHGLS